MNPIMKRRESVCRSLFGPVDHDQLRRDLKQRLKEINEQDSRRWNFNFETDTPLPGRFQWEEVPADCAAALYQESAQLKNCSSITEEEEEDGRLSDREEDSEGADQDQENCSSISNTRKCPAEVTPVRRKRTHSKQAAKPRNNARITDFFAKRRRTTETKSILNPFHTSSSEAAQCKTIR
ncbi:cyclin dependent kinase inhibitor 1Ca [Symphorus nematophorus]